MRVRHLPTLLLPIILAACAKPSPTTSSAADLGPKKVAHSSTPFAEEVLAAAHNYTAWTRVSDQANWAPTNCRAPAPEGAQVSQSGDHDTHGKKLYYLFAKVPGQYTTDAFKDGSSIGQALVKESWTPVKVDKAKVPTAPFEIGARRHPPEYAFSDNGEAFKTGERAPLFVMLKLDPATKGTDEGWVYATLTPNAKTILQSGRIESCMECHVGTKTHDRLFGPAWARRGQQP
jgi:hypothetical protein